MGFFSSDSKNETVNHNSTQQLANYGDGLQVTTDGNVEIDYLDSDVAIASVEGAFDFATGFGEVGLDMQRANNDFAGRALTDQGLMYEGALGQLSGLTGQVLSDQSLMYEGALGELTGLVGNLGGAQISASEPVSVKTNRSMGTLAALAVGGVVIAMIVGAWRK